MHSINQNIAIFCPDFFSKSNWFSSCMDVLQDWVIGYLLVSALLLEKSDFNFFLRCQCNGHATHCIEGNGGEEGVGSTTTMVCLCQHGTDGPNCEHCLPDHWDRPWRRATSQIANECKRKWRFDSNVERGSVTLRHEWMRRSSHKDGWKRWVFR